MLVFLPSFLPSFLPCARETPGVFVWREKCWSRLEAQFAKQNQQKLIENGSQWDQQIRKSEEKSIPEGSGRRLGVMWGALGRAGRALGLKNRQFLTQTPAVLESFLIILASFWCFFLKLFFNMVSGPFFHDLGIIFDFILPSF